MSRPDELAERAGAWVHAVHGTRGLTLGGALLLLVAFVEPWLPDSVPGIVYSLPLTFLIVLGLATLPREGVAAKRRARALLDAPDAMQRMRRRLAYGAGLAAALLPNFFLAVQGIPHLSPFAGLVTPEFLRWIGFVGLFGVLLLAVLYLRSSKGYAPEIVPLRPNMLRDDSATHADRDVILVSMWLVVLLWAWMLQGFWRPFSLLEWHGADLGAYLASFRLGVRGVAGLFFAIIPPVLLFMVLSAHLDLLREIQRRRAWAEERTVAAFALLHATLCVVAVVLHAYDLFWIVRYRSLGFL